MVRNVARFLVLFAVLAIGASASRAAADTYTCTTYCTFGPSDTLDNLTVKSGGIAVLNGTHVTGSIVVEGGCKLTLKSGVEVEGNVQSFGGTKVKISDTTIGGSLQVKYTKNINVQFTTVDGDLQLENNKINRHAKIHSCFIGGNLQVNKCKLGVYELRLTSNDVYGNLQLVENTQGTIVVNDNVVSGALQCSDNDSAIVGNGNIAGDLECPELQ